MTFSSRKWFLETWFSSGALALQARDLVSIFSPHPTNTTLHTKVHPPIELTSRKRVLIEVGKEWVPPPLQAKLMLTSCLCIPIGISASSPLQASIVRPTGLADFGPSSASSPLSSPLSKGNNVPGTPKTLHLTSSLGPDSLARKQGKGTHPSGSR